MKDEGSTNSTIRPPPNVIINDDLPQPEPAAGQLLVRVKAAGVVNWDAFIREGKVELRLLPLVLGSELSGIVEAMGAEISAFKVWTSPVSVGAPVRY